jgi:hypothetical protein
MARLLKNLAGFLGIGLALLVPVCLLCRRAHHRTLEAPVFRLKPEITTLVLGDSHPEGAVDPRHLPHSANISHSGDNYFYSYEKLNFLLSRNPQATTVILGFSWHNFPANYQESFLFGEAKGKIEAFFPILDAEGRALVASWNSAYLVPWAQNTLGLPLKFYDDGLLWRQLRGARLHPDDFEFFGGFEDTGVSHIDESIIKQKAASYFLEAGGSPSPTSPYMTQYFFKILDLCTSRGIRVVLLNTPVHPLYRSRVPEASVRTFEELRAQVALRYPGVAYLDFSDLPIEASGYYDGDHVNRRGAETVTRRLASLL